MYKTYTKEVYDNSVKKTREMIMSSSYTIDGYCEMQNGIIYFRGDIPGVSHSQARYYLIYMIRDIYGPEVWINPIFFSISKSNKNNYKDRAIYFTLKPYKDNNKRIFIEFSSTEKRKQYKDKQDFGDLMPTPYKVNELPEIKTEDLYFVPTEPTFELSPFADPVWDINMNPSTNKSDKSDDMLLDDMSLDDMPLDAFFSLDKYSTTLRPETQVDNYDYGDYYVSLKELEDSCNLPEGYHLFDDDR